VNNQYSKNINLSFFKANYVKIFERVKYGVDPAMILGAQAGKRASRISPFNFHQKHVIRMYMEG